MPLWESCQLYQQRSVSSSPAEAGLCRQTSPEREERCLPPPPPSQMEKSEEQRLPRAKCRRCLSQRRQTEEMASNFTNRFKKDLSTQALKTKLVRQKSLLRKESRHNEFNKGRQFGPVDVNTQASRDRELSRLDDPGEGHSTNSSAKSINGENYPPPPQSSHASRIPNATTKAREVERFQMLQRYKAEKELRKLKEQREKPIFKCGRFKPEDPSFLPKGSQIPVLNIAKETATKASCTEGPPVSVTRSKAKNQLPEPAKPQLPAEGPPVSVTRSKAKNQLPEPAKPQLPASNLDGSFVFTPLRSKAENPVDMLACDDLIVFSPVRRPEGGNNGMD